MYVTDKKFPDKILKKLQNCDANRQKCQNFRYPHNLVKSMQNSLKVASPAPCTTILDMITAH